MVRESLHQRALPEPAGVQIKSIYDVWFNGSNQTGLTVMASVSIVIPKPL